MVWCVRVYMCTCGCMVTYWPRVGVPVVKCCMEVHACMCVAIDQYDMHVM